MMVQTLVQTLQQGYEIGGRKINLKLRARTNLNSSKMSIEQGHIRPKVSKMLNINNRIDAHKKKEFVSPKKQISILNNSRENHVSPYV